MVPISWRWQEVEDLQMIDKFIFGGVLGAITGRHLDKNLDSGLRIQDSGFTPTTFSNYLLYYDKLFSLISGNTSHFGTIIKLALPKNIPQCYDPILYTITKV